jgi:hypothetical protein
MPCPSVEPCRVDVEDNLSRAGDGRRDVTELETVGVAVLVLDDGFHRDHNLTL